MAAQPQLEVAAHVGPLARDDAVHLTGTGIYYLSKPAPNEFVLGFSAISERAIREAVRRLALTAT